MKLFVGSDTIRNNALRLAMRIHDSGFEPDVIYVSLRGGAALGNALSEYYKLASRHRRPVYYAAVVAHSYSGIHKQDSIRVDGWTYPPEHLRLGDRVLLVDDIFDSGKTINHLAGIILERGIPRSDLKIAVHDYKVRHFEKQVQDIQPDFWCVRHEVDSPEKDPWIHYLGHELGGLTPGEIREHYLQDDPAMESLFDRLFGKGQDQ